MSQDAGKVEKSNDQVTITRDFAVSLIESYKRSGIISSNGRIQHTKFEEMFEQRDVKGVELISKESRRKYLRYIYNIRDGIYHGTSFTPTRASMEAMVVPTYLTPKPADIISTEDIKTVIYSTSDAYGSEILEAGCSASSFVESFYTNNPVCFPFLKDFARRLVNAQHIGIDYPNIDSDPFIIKQAKRLGVNEVDIIEQYQKNIDDIALFKSELIDLGFDVEKKLCIRSTKALDCSSVGVYINVHPLHQKSWSILSNPLQALFFDTCDFIPKQNCMFSEQEISKITIGENY